MDRYHGFIAGKTQLGEMHGFKPLWMPDFLFDFQKALTEWNIEKGRGALFEDCGLGKTPQYLVWAENVVRHTNKPVLVCTPLAVSGQVVREAGKFGIEAHQSRDGKKRSNITVTNYEMLHQFDPNDFSGMVCDESGILKNFKGKLKNDITVFMRKMQYRSLASATAAPNDYPELGTQSEALGDMGFMDMLNKFFKNDQNNSKVGRHCGNEVKWRLRGHAEKHFWRWVCSWSRAIRKPSDIGFDDGDFILPLLAEVEHIVEAKKLAEGMLFALPAVGMREQREERRRTVDERCEAAANLVNHTGKPFISWCHLNDEGDLLEKMIPDAVQVSGKDSDDAKEEKLSAFASCQVRGLVIKPVIGAWGMNWQHCAHMTTFPSHSFEQYYQLVRRCWRFGQKNEVKVDIVTTEGEQRVLQNHQRKAIQADVMFDNMILEMNNALGIGRHVNKFDREEIIPSWL